MNAREQWLVDRRCGLGGSDIGAILGLSQYRTPVDIWMEKTGRAAAQEETLQMRFGVYAEEFVAREYSARTGLAVQRYKAMLHHPSAPLLGNVDRLVVPAGAKVASHKQKIRTDKGLECKTASAFASFDADEWGPEGTDLVPASYLVQCATYMALTGCALWDLAVLFGNQEVRIYGLKRDADLEDEILSRAAEWWERHVVADVAPEPTCIADVKSLYARVTDTTIDADEMLIHWSHVAEDAAKKSGEYQSVADTAKMHLLAAMRDAAVLRLDGNRAFRRKVIHKKEYVVEATSYVDARLTTLRNEK
jgi:putative phage-type endonuclease